MKKLILYLFILLFVMPFEACQKNDYPYCDTSSRLRLLSEEVLMVMAVTSRIRRDSVRFSFRTIDTDASEAIVRFEAHLVGKTAPVDRPFLLEVVEEKTNVPASVYALEPLILPANASYATISMKVQKSVPGLDLSDWENNVAARVAFRLAPNEHFLPHEDRISGFIFTVSWCDYLTKPASWTYLVDNRFGQFNQSFYQFFIRATGETEFTKFSTSLPWLETFLRRALAEYNAQADAEGRPHWRADNGTDLVI